ncbi:MAG: DNA polymerase III subunit alpha [Bacteroidetes bacterium GWE2_41_25]|nr:MAG: DNA polymerase III subunit alpha [Bacteroidetes bacterium GWA2_40_15]OFX90923.1 MAG: DNA polymerase III subunit alpha [Bacteroidetes bacterium GWE2_41_25]OFY01440.1 MAG: DNA polymerase III subunit alpha [Bacteroidetes bacterium GWC2_40_22]OFY59316.1 MAG: DNA polymerase III subunit alpha [Bacteroidetes bacterium GWF2_41_9]HBH84387.1 DNA polymerase III subunit alpha [Bacteroidales bacterium]
MAGFAHLHVHTQYSILDGASSIPLLIERVKNLGMEAVAITDHGNMFGVKEFHNIAVKKGIKPIIGCEIYVAKRSIREINVKEDRSGDHLILLAKNLTGYKNLIKLVSTAWIKGFYYKPRIDKELLAKYKEGLIASSACLAGEIQDEILNGTLSGAEAVLQGYLDIFGDDFYLEIQRHETYNPDADRSAFPLQQKVIEAFKKLSVKYNVKVIASNDVHFVNADDAEAHDRLICINTAKDIDDPNRLRYSKQEYLKSEDEMRVIFSDIPEAIDNVAGLVEKIEKYKLDHDPIMPEFELPEGYSDKDQYLRYLSFKGATERWGELTREQTERLDFELEMIARMGFPGYFLIVQDFLRAAREMGVSVGPGRGSAAGSAVAFALRITDIDPIRYGLLFERFLNLDRISMPDIDIDFDEDGRDSVLRYVVNKYGHDKVAHIITFGSMAAKMAIRDVARVQKLPLPDADRLAKLVPERPGVTLADAYTEVPELAKERDSSNKLIAQTLKYAQVLEGSVRQTGVHACGIIIGKDSLDNYIPLCTAKDTDLYATQYDGSHVEAVGLLKMDFLGLKTLSIIKDSVENIKKSKKTEIVIENLPLDDKKTFELFSNGETTGIFQFESTGMKRYLRDLKPNRFEDLIAMNALYRPGPMEYIPKFIRRKHGQEKIDYPLPVMEKYLDDTYGITVYQEQVMLLSQLLGGFSKGQADSLRKAMGKKKRSIMDEMKLKFQEGCAKNGYEEATVNKIWSDWEAFAQYAFNKSHSTCYAMVAFQTGYLKAHYPAEYMAAVLSRNISDIKKITTFMDETRRMGMEVLGPDANESNLKFTVNKDGNIRFGLGAIKGVGEAAALQLIEEREMNGLYKDIYDLVERVNLNSLNKKNLEAMAVAGAFDCFSSIIRAQYFSLDTKGLSFIESLIRYGNTAKTIRNSSQHSLFGDTGGFEMVRPEPALCPDWPKLEKLNREKEVIGIYLSSHPLDDFRLEISTFTTATLADLQNLRDYLDRDVVVAGMVTDTKNGIGKNGKPYGSFTIQDYSDSFRFMLFDKDFLDNSKFCIIGYYLLVRGRVQLRRYKDDEIEFKVKTINLLSSVKDELIKSVTLKIDPADISHEMINELKEMVVENKGETELRFLFTDPEDKVVLPMFSRTFRIRLNNELISFLEDFPGIEFKVN